MHPRHNKSPLLELADLLGWTRRAAWLCQRVCWHPLSVGPWRATPSPCLRWSVPTDGVGPRRSANRSALGTTTSTRRTARPRTAKLIGSRNAKGAWQPASLPRSSLSRWERQNIESRRGGSVTTPSHRQHRDMSNGTDDSRSHIGLLFSNEGFTRRPMATRPKTSLPARLIAAAAVNIDVPRVKVSSMRRTRFPARRESATKPSSVARRASRSKSRNSGSVCSKDAGAARRVDRTATTRSKSPTQSA